MAGARGKERRNGRGVFYDKMVVEGSCLGDLLPLVELRPEKNESSEFMNMLTSMTEVKVERNGMMSASSGKNL